MTPVIPGTSLVLGSPTVARRLGRFAKVLTSSIVTMAKQEIRHHCDCLPPPFSSSLAAMVTKKYLCNAPRQEVWDEKVEAMLKSLRGTEKQKRKYIRKTLQGLQEEQYVFILRCFESDSAVWNEG